MSEVVNVVSTHDMTGGGGADERPNFTCNIAALDVPVNAPGVSTGILRCGDTSKYKIQAKDGFIIQSVGVLLPYNFVLSVTAFIVSLQWVDAGGNGTISQFGIGGNFTIPMSNYECPVNAFIPWPTPRLLPMYLQMNAVAIEYGRISMVGVPGGFAAATVPFNYFAKISTNMVLV